MLDISCESSAVCSADDSLEMLSLVFSEKNNKKTLRMSSVTILFSILRPKITIFTLSNVTPYLLTILVLKFQIVHSTTC